MDGMESIEETAKGNGMNLVTIKQAAESLSVHPNTIRNWMKAGKIKAIKFGPNTIRISLDELKGQEWTSRD